MRCASFGMIALLVCRAAAAEPLQLHQPLDRDLAPGRSAAFTVDVAAGQYCQVIARQKGVDVVVTVLDPGGKELLTADSPTSVLGPESAAWIAIAAGAYTVKVTKSARSNEMGHYEIELTDLRAPTSDDRTRIQALTKLYAAVVNERTGTKESRSAALQAYDEAANLWHGLHDAYEEALCRQRMGSVHYALAEYAKALPFFEQALTLSRSAGDKSSEGNALWSIGNIRFVQADRQKALVAYQQALAIKRAVGDRPGETTLLANISSLYLGMFDFKKAADASQQALAVARANGDQKNEVTALINIGASWAAQGEQTKALDSMQQGLAAARAANDRLAEANVLASMGAIYSERGETQKAMELFQRALPILRAQNDRANEAATLINIGNCYRDLGAMDKSMDYYRQSIALGRTGNESSALMGLGDDYFYLGEKQKSIDYYQQSLTGKRAAGDRSGEALALIGLGNVYTDLGGKQKGSPPTAAERKKGLDDFEQALAIGRAIPDFNVQVFALMGGGVAYSSLGDKKKALEYFNAAMFIFGIAKFQQGQGWAQYEIARVQRDLGNLAEARTLASKVREIVESLRTKVSSLDLRASFFAAVDDCYGLEMDVLMKMHKADPSKKYDAEALALSERVRARVLLEALGEARANIREGVDATLLERERTLQADLNAKEAARIQLLGAGRPGEELQEMEKAVKDLAAQYEDVNGRIRAASPHYAALGFPQPLTVAEIQKEVLDADTVLVEYSLLDQASFVWAVSPDGVASATLPGRSEIEKAAKSYRDALLDASGKTSPDAGKALSRMLFGPIAPGLEGKRLLIVADGALQYLPFAALPDPVETAQPLVVKHEIVNVPSASTVAILRRENRSRKPAEKLLAVIADPVFSADDPRLARAQAAAKVAPIGNEALQRSLNDVGLGGQRLFRLPGTRREAAGIVSLVAADQRREALDFDASREVMMSPEIGRYRILHLATHGLLDSVHPELSGVVLSLVDRKGQPQDGFLRLNEIYNLKLGADLVVLSACQTALGKEIQGEGLVGLTRGFMYAGAPRVMASLWKVDDRATAELMKRFYGAMLGGRKLQPVAALREAQVQMWKMKEFASPYYWAAFTLQGEWR